MGKSFKDRSQKYPKILDRRQIENEEEFDWKEHIRIQEEEEVLYKEQEEMNELGKESDILEGTE